MTRSASFFEHEKSNAEKTLSLSRTGQKILATSRPPATLRYAEMERDFPMNFLSGELKASKFMVHFQRQVPGLGLNSKPLLKAQHCPTISIQSCFQCFNAMEIPKL